MLNNVKFETSIFNYNNILNTNKPQIVLVGKSNVGKSSFINTITNQKKLAKVGQTPGKTRSINFFNVNDEFYLVDLPGYGFSKMSDIQKQQINKLIDTYISKSKNIKHIFFLVDIRNKPSQNDRQMYEWLLNRNVPFTIVATKADKIANTKINDYIKEIRKLLFAKEEIISFSSEKKINVDIICDKIVNFVKHLVNRSIFYYI